MGIGLGHMTSVRNQGIDLIPMIVDRLTLRVAQGAIHDGKRARRLHQTSRQFQIVEQRLLGLEFQIGFRSGLGCLGDFRSSDSTTQLPVLGLGAHNECHFLLATRNRSACI